MLKKLGISPDELQKPEIKARLKGNTDEAIQRGVFGVPNFEVDDEVFWGADSIEFLKDFLRNPSAVKNQEMQRLDALPVASARRTS